jgi:hypothetical protein
MTPAKFRFRQLKLINALTDWTIFDDLDRSEGEKNAPVV